MCDRQYAKDSEAHLLEAVEEGGEVGSRVAPAAGGGGEGGCRPGLHRSLDHLVQEDPEREVHQPRQDGLEPEHRRTKGLGRLDGQSGCFRRRLRRSVCRYGMRKWSLLFITSQQFLWYSVIICRSCHGTFAKQCKVEVTGTQRSSCTDGAIQRVGCLDTDSLNTGKLTETECPISWQMAGHCHGWSDVLTEAVRCFNSYDQTPRERWTLYYEQSVASTQMTPCLTRSDVSW